ncbi:YaaC family protein [Leptospira sp. WS60.C2]
MFIKFQPSLKPLMDLYTSNSIYDQLWQEFISIRHSKSQKKIKSKKSISPWIDQSKIYFLDAHRSNWKSAGLLYYYSFLNLAKAFIVGKGKTSAKLMRSLSFYHGLSSLPQIPKNLSEFEIEIHPTNTNKKTGNIFSIFYKELTGKQWPFKTKIAIKLKEIMAYSPEVSTEINQLYSINRGIINIQSLLLFDKSDCWFQFCVPNYEKNRIQTCINNSSYTVSTFLKLPSTEKQHWLDAYNLSFSESSNYLFFTRVKRSYNNLPINEVINQETVYIAKEFSNNYSPYWNSVRGEKEWLFIPQINLNGNSLVWSPLLTDYLIAFALSTQLRYYPHLFPNDSADSFFAESWCNQAAITALRNFLIIFTEPSIRLN